MYVQSAEDLRVDAARSTLRLVKVNPQTLYFSDRPKRVAGHLKMADYLKTWKEGGDNFGADPAERDPLGLRAGARGADARGDHAHEARSRMARTSLYTYKIVEERCLRTAARRACSSIGTASGAGSGRASTASASGPAASAGADAGEASTGRAGIEWQQTLHETAIEHDCHRRGDPMFRSSLSAAHACDRARHIITLPQVVSHRRQPSQRRLATSSAAGRLLFVQNSTGIEYDKPRARWG
jgi:hypothetical protein